MNTLKKKKKNLLCSLIICLLYFPIFFFMLLFHFRCEWNHINGLMGWSANTGSDTVWCIWSGLYSYTRLNSSLNRTCMGSVPASFLSFADILAVSSCHGSCEFSPNFVSGGLNELPLALAGWAGGRTFGIPHHKPQKNKLQRARIEEKLKRREKMECGMLVKYHCLRCR